CEDTILSVVKPPISDIGCCVVARAVSGILRCERSALRARELCETAQPHLHPEVEETVGIVFGERVGEIAEHGELFRRERTEMAAYLRLHLLRAAAHR